MNADAVLEKLYSDITDLYFMAGSHHLYPNEPWNSEGVHYFSVNNYSVYGKHDSNSLLRGADF